MARIGSEDLARLFRLMVRMRAFERAVAGLWQDGLINGELHLGIGEEAAVAGVIDHLLEGDGVALDHRSTPPLVARGTDVAALLLELFGSREGLCRGMGGHMHLFDRDRLMASSGIVGASAPLGCGFALAAAYLRPGAVAVAFFGEGAVNQGMLMESLNLASVWRLPLVFVCKDSGLAIATRSRTVTAGRLDRRAAAFDMPTARVSGADVGAVWLAAGRAVHRARTGGGPTFLQVRCRRPEGHFLGDPLLRASREPTATSAEIGPPLLRAMRTRPRASASDRGRGLAHLVPPMAAALYADRVHLADPVRRARRRLDPGAAGRIEAEAAEEIAGAVREARRHRELSAWPA